jgi:hypothetical protein
MAPIPSATTLLGVRAQLRLVAHLGSGRSSTSSSRRGPDSGAVSVQHQSPW